jgi:hypothetical protein
MPSELSTGYPSATEHIHTGRSSAPAGLVEVFGIRCAVELNSCSTSPARPATAGGISSTPESTSTSLSPDQTAKIDAVARASLAHGVTGAIVSISDPTQGSYLKAYGRRTPLAPR